MTGNWTDYFKVPIFYAMVLFFVGQIGVAINTLIVFDLSFAMLWACVCGVSLTYILERKKYLAQFTDAPTRPTHTELDTYYRAQLKGYKHGQYVYLVKSADSDGLCKIGMTSQPRDRIANFDGGLPFRVLVLAIIPTDDMRKMERFLHGKNAHRRVNGEWYMLEPHVIDTICDLALKQAIKD